MDVCGENNVASVYTEGGSAAGGDTYLIFSLS